MQPLRIDVVELKAQIVKKIGPERSKRYFCFLNRLLNQKLSKGEFDKLCFRLLGRENLPLHNQFIRSILKNACEAKAPPSTHKVGSDKYAGKSSYREDGHEQNGYTNLGVPANGVALPISPRKGRSMICDGKVGDRAGLIRSSGKAYSPYQSTAPEDRYVKISFENGNLISCDFQRPMQHLQGYAEQPDCERPKTRKSADALVSLPSKEQIGVQVVEDGEEVDRANYINRSLLRAPLGIPFCSASAGGASKLVPVSSISDVVSFFDSGGLSNRETLRRRMEQIAAAQSLGRVSTECATTLNNMLDVYLKQLIRSCFELVGARSWCKPEEKQPAHSQQIQGKVINGMWLSNRLHMQSTSGPPEIIQEQRPSCSISLFDFKVAMELKPQQLGEDWPLLLEKISMHAFEK